MAKHFKKNVKKHEQKSKYRHIRESKKDKLLQKVSDFTVAQIKKISSFFSEILKKVKPKDSYQSKYGENKKTKIIEFQEEKKKYYKTASTKREQRYKEEKGVKKGVTPDSLPTSQQLEAELERVCNKRDNNSLLRNTIFSLITISAVVVLIAIFVLPVFQIYGTSMSPTFTEGDVVVSVKGSDFEQGDIISFYYNNKILVKRVVAFEGDYVNIDEDGNVYVNKKKLDEPYIDKKSLGECNIDLPYQVPARKYFVLGDYRSTSVDSRNNVMGCVSEEQIIGKIIFRVWPFDRFGTVD